MRLKLTALLLIVLTTSGCSFLNPLNAFKKPQPVVEVQMQTVEIPIEITQPTLPRAIDMKEPKWYVVSDAVIANPCNKDEEGNTLVDEDGNCELGREHPDWPEGYTYLDRFLEDIVEESGALVFTAMSIADYELMAFNLQEIRRYVQEMNEVIVYYRKVTMPEEGEEINTETNSETE
jgi:hypothetical protein